MRGAAAIFRAASVASVVSLVAPANAYAAVWILHEEGSTQNAPRADATLSMWVERVGVAGWFVIPVRPEGVLPGVSESLELELGALISFYDNAQGKDAAILPLGGLRWHFQLTPEWSAFAALKTGAYIGLDEALVRPRIGGSVGAYWHMFESAHLRIEAGYPGALQVGVSVPY